MAIYYLGIQGSYKHLDIALLKDTKHLSSISMLDGNASSHLITYLDQLLSTHSLSLHDISFIALDHGPGAYTSLRVTLTTLNAISFAQNIPLVGIDGLTSLAYQAHKDPARETKYTLVLLNAYAGEVYATLYKHTHDGSLTCILPNFVASIHECFTQVSQKCINEPINCIGNGIEVAYESLKSLPNIYSIPKKVALVASGVSIAQLGFQQWEKGKFTTTITPYYLKLQQFKQKTRY